MEFKYNGSCFQADVRYKTNHIAAICDTGASYTAIDIHSLAILTGHSPAAIYKQALEWIDRKYDFSIVHTASGSVNRVISIQLNNVKIHDLLFENFFIKLNIDNELWRTDGSLIVDNKTININPSILIGHDIIRSCNIQGRSDKILLLDFDKNFYTKTVQEKYKDTLHIYLSNEKKSYQTDIFSIIKNLKHNNKI